MTLEAVQAMIDQTLLRNNTTNNESQNSGGGPRRPMQPERQAENKRKLDNNNQAQQQLLKKQNVVQAYDVGTGEKKPYKGSKPLCPKYNYHHDGECVPKNQGHYMSDCTVLKNQGTEARGRVYALGGGETNQDLDNAGDDINA
nr:hypothetical protein [Tanacetum cinerariifolium]